MRTTISKTWSFDAAHRLPNHAGKCAQPHGHTYRLTVAVVGEPRALDGNSSEGMVLDFGVLEDVWKRLKPVLDHRDLNETVGADAGVTTCERLAALLWDEFASDLPTEVAMEYVRVSETAATYAEVRG